MTYIFGRKLGLPDKLATLIGIGTAICGTTA
nr:putative sulfate exporter family transporter [Desulforamulus aquiferis]